MSIARVDWLDRLGLDFAVISDSSNVWLISLADDFSISQSQYLTKRIINLPDWC